MIRRVLMPSLLAALLVAGILGVRPARAGAPAVACTGDPTAVNTVSFGATFAYYAVPAKHPRGVVVFDHGYGHNPEGWVAHLTDTAKRDQVIAVAPEYTGTPTYTDSLGGQQYSPTVDYSRGWKVAEGAQDSIAVAKLFDDSCGGLRTNVIYGVSMGGNASGLVAATKAARKDGKPLFDYWFDVEGVTNVTETYLEARSFKNTGSTFAANAQSDIENEMGGPIEQNPGAYLAHTVVAQDVTASGIRGVVLVHGVDDGTVPYDQTREMAARLRQLGLPNDVFTVGTHGPSNESGGTIENDIDPSFSSPFSGHGDEAHFNQLVIKTGFDRLAALYDQHDIPACREFFVDGTLATTAPLPSLPC